MVKIRLLYLKGVVESLFVKLNLNDRISYVKSQRFEELHPGRTADIYLDDKVIGVIENFILYIRGT